MLCKRREGFGASWLMMKIEFKPVTAEDSFRLSRFYGLRPNKTCDSVFLDSFLWKDYFHVHCAVCDDRAVLWLMRKDGRFFTAMPVCSEEDLPYYFRVMVDYFDKELGQTFCISLADEEAVQALDLDPAEFEVTPKEDAKDYLYDGEALRTLAGKKLHKKKNHLNAFMRAYAGRYEYRALSCEDRQEIWAFLTRWRALKEEADDLEDSLEYEVAGIFDIVKNCSRLQAKMAGVSVDGRLEAFTIGSLNERENMAVIHVEKANPAVNGLYQYINQQFLVHEFPAAALINREDDMGDEGLRRAKMSYNPVGFARKYMVRKK